MPKRWAIPSQCPIVNRGTSSLPEFSQDLGFPEMRWASKRLGSLTSRSGAQVRAPVIGFICHRRLPIAFVIASQCTLCPINSISTSWPQLSRISIGMHDSVGLTLQLAAIFAAMQRVVGSAFPVRGMMPATAYFGSLGVWYTIYRWYVPSTLCGVNVNKTTTPLPGIRKVGKKQGQTGFFRI